MTHKCSRHYFLLAEKACSENLVLRKDLDWLLTDSNSKPGYNCCAYLFYFKQAWESTYSKWQRITFDLVNFAKEDSSSIDVQKYLRRRSGTKITTESVQVCELSKTG